MFDIIKLKLEIQELKKKMNTIENRYETLKDERIDEIIKAIVDKDRNEGLEEENKKLKLKIQTLKEIINDRKQR